jgi:2-(1,2-epoxy-1,2-dihydrophenyl)acetyl-CoA isomerase
MTDGLVRLDWQDEVAIISLNRPARHNALIPELLLDLLAALSDERCLSAPVLILRAEGDSFSTGGDLLGFWQKRGNIADYAHELVGLLNQAIVAIYTHPAVVVCAVQGQVTGGSLGLLLASDRVIMCRKATITPWYGEVGFSPDGGWKALLPEIIGHQRAMQWLASNGCYDALACMNLGVVHQVVDEDCTVSALKWAENAAGNKSDLTSRDHSLSNLNTNELCYRLEVERESFVTQIQTQQALDGISQFLRRA